MQAPSAIRVLLALDGLAADLLERRLREDLEFEPLVLDASGDVLEAARRTQPDFVVLPLPELPAQCDAVELFDAVPRVRVLTLETAAGRAFLSELIGDVSPDELADALRRAATREAL